MICRPKMTGKWLTLLCVTTCLILAAVNAKKRFYKTFYIDVPLDHFSFAVNKTFKLRYLLNDTYWNKDDGPVLFYTGNEVGRIYVIVNKVKP